MKKICVFWLAICAWTMAWSAGEDYGRYAIRNQMESSSLDMKVEIKGTETREIYRTMANRPAYYKVGVPAGQYEVVVHYLAAIENAEKKDPEYFSVEVDGEEKIGQTPCFVKPRKGGTPASMEARQRRFKTESKGEMLKIRFPRRYDQVYEICALEVLGDNVEFRINCGSKEDVTDAKGRNWKMDRPLPMPFPTIQLDENDTVDEWVNISDEMIRKLRENGVEPTPKWKGHYTRHSNGVFWDRSGHVYVNFAAVGFWEYGGPGGTLERLDEGKYTSVHKGESINPYGPGFVLVCSHGYNPKDSYQLLSWDGVTLETWASDGDVGACDWQQKGTPKLIFWKPRHNKILTVSEDGGKTMRQVVEKENIRNVGALGDGVLVYTTGGRNDDPSFGIYRSADKGATWEKVHEGNMLGNVNCSPILSYENRAYLQTDKGLYKSSDRGKTWRLVEDSPVFTFTLQTGREGDKHMTGLSRQGIFESFDQGETWTKVAEAPPVPKDQKWLQSHDYYDFSWDFEKNIFYCSAPDSAWRYVRK